MGARRLDWRWSPVGPQPGEWSRVRRQSGEVCDASRVDPRPVGRHVVGYRWPAFHRHDETRHAGRERRLQLGGRRAAPVRDGRRRPLLLSLVDKWGACHDRHQARIRSWRRAGAVLQQAHDDDRRRAVSRSEPGRHAAHDLQPGSILDVWCGREAILLIVRERSGSRYRRD